MSTKVNMMDIAHALVRRSNISYADSTSFVRQFFETLQEALMHEKIVKVRGLGTFKLVSVEPRESVSVVDGSRIRIAGHTKISFTPDAVLRDAVNKPFAEFETVILSDNLDLSAFDDLETEAIVPSLEETKSSDTEAIKQPNISMEEELQASPEEVSSFENDVTDSEEEGSAVSEGVIEEDGEAIPIEDNSDETSVDSENIILTETQGESLEKDVEDEPESTISEVYDSDDSLGNNAENNAVETKGDVDPLESEKATVADIETTASAPSDLMSSQKSSAILEKHESAISRCFKVTAIILSFLLFGALFYAIGYVRPLKHDILERATNLWETYITDLNKSGITEQPSKSIQKNTATKSTPIAITDSASATIKTNPTDSVAVSTSKVPSETLAYPQLENGEYWIVGIKGTEIMKPGRTLLNFSLKYYKSKDFVPYICVMNDITNPDVVPLNKELRIPELRKK